MEGIEDLGCTEAADRLLGNSGANKLVAFDGNDTLDGGAGKDVLAGGAGSDTYKFAAGWGQDAIYEEQGTNSTDVDVVAFQTGVEYNKLWFSRTGDNLLIQYLGTADALSIADWYKDPKAKVERIEVNGYAINGVANIEALTTQMAAFSAPASMGNLSKISQSTIYSSMGKYWAVKV